MTFTIISVTAVSSISENTKIIEIR